MKNILIAFAIFLNFNFLSLAKSNIQDVDCLNVICENFAPVIKVMQYNVNKNPFCENVENTKWQNRSPRIKDLIIEAEPDIICLQEMRELPENYSDNYFLSTFNNYRYFIWYKNPVFDFSFGQAILYKPEKFYPLTSFPLWLSDTPEIISDNWNKNKAQAFGSMVLCVKFVHTYNNKIVKNAAPLWVFNVHFPTPEDLNEKSCYKILEIVKNVAGEDPFLICGDFNFFPDRNGKKHKEILTKQLIDFGSDAITLGGKKLEGTFIGYETDPFKADLKNIKSRLDYIFGSNHITKIDDAILYTKTMLKKEPEELTTRDYPSDHLPLLVKIQIRKTYNI